MHYSGSQPPVTRGGNGETRSDIILAPAEYITTITGTVKHSVIASLRFVTNRGISPTNIVFRLYSLLTPTYPGSSFGPYGQAGASPSRGGVYVAGRGECHPDGSRLLLRPPRASGGQPISARVYVAGRGECSCPLGGAYGLTLLHRERVVSLI